MNPFKKLIAASGVVAALAAAPLPAAADMQDQMKSMFNSMVNISPPGLYATQRRGEISGGGVFVRNRIVNPNIVSFSPPSFRAGCGGIDFFTGSFSFINSEQFVQLMKAVAANAAGYAFNLALDQMCPQCLRTIETLQRKIQELNQYFGNSCQLAQGIVNDTMAAATGRRYGEASIVGVAEGIGDVFSSWTSADGRSPTEAVAKDAPEKMKQHLEGNLVWRALKRSDVDDWFVTGGDDQILSVAMTISGTIIVDYDEELDSFDIQSISGKPELIESFIEGAPVKYYSCVEQDENGCLSPTLKTANWTGDGFAAAIFNRLTDPDDGAIATIRTAGDPNEAMRRLVVSVPGRLGAMFVRLAAISAPAAETFAREAAYQLAIEMTAQLLSELNTVVTSATDAIDDAHSLKVKEIMAASDRASRAELARLQRKYGSVQELLDLYAGFLSASELSVAGAIRARQSH